MENMVMHAPFWRGRRVLVTGHSGFKGGWLTLWLRLMGAEVCGLGLAPDMRSSLFNDIGVGDVCHSVFADINQPDVMDDVIREFRPEIIFHLAAQALVRPSYEDPVGTYATNVLGVVRLLDAVRRSPDVLGVVIVTSDKCYENVEQRRGYSETDALGGHDPYSSSKGAAEIAARSMQRSYFQPFARNGHPARIATVRAGNVIGGGDWSPDRLVPDIVRGLLMGSGDVVLRNPGAVRPWQHVLEPLAFYLRLAERLVVSPDGVDEAWNVGPDAADMRPVRELAETMCHALGSGRIIVKTDPNQVHEAQLLTLDCTKARIRMGWVPLLGFSEAVGWTAGWYSEWHKSGDLRQFTRGQIEGYCALGAKKAQPGRRRFVG